MADKASSWFAELALLPDGWARDVRLEIDDDGRIAALAVGGTTGGAERFGGPIVPGMPNLHSHAFQRAMAGLAEFRADARDDDFWSWRQVMYGFVAKLTPEQVEAIAAQLYVEMLEAGYTSVAEFHYLHHDRGGAPFAEPTEMSTRIVAAASEAGIGLTLLPTLYVSGGFGDRPAHTGQRRFVNSAEGFLRILETLNQRHRNDRQVRIGMALHSLRAVPPPALAAAAAGAAALDATMPVHVHVAEQLREVEECLAWSGRRPVEWLFEHAAVDRRWCLVHATHMTDAETAALARSGAVAGLCPTTEANLGDGLFQASAYLSAGGAFGIGSDSHVSVDPIEELRWLEYGQRLIARQRNRLVDGAGSVGERLFLGALDGGAQALGRRAGSLQVGAEADLVVLDRNAPCLAERPPERLLDALVFAAQGNPVTDAMVGGKWLVRGGRHARRDRVFERYRAALRELAG